MDPNHAPSAPSFAMASPPSLSELLASVRGTGGERAPAYGFASLPVHSFAPAAHAVPLSAATRTFTLDPDEPFSSMQPPPLEPRSAGGIRSAAAASPFSFSAAGVPAHLAAVASRDNNSMQPRRRSQRLAAHTSSSSAAASRDVTEASVSSDGRKRRARSTTITTPRKRAARKKPPPNAKDDSEALEDSKPAAVEDNEEEGGGAVSCCICMCEPEKEEVSSTNGCQHLFCFECIGKWADRENTCPLCKSRFTSISRVHKCKKRKGGRQVPNSKRVKQRDQRADVISGPAIEAMLASIAAASNATPGRLGRFLVALGSRRPPTVVASRSRTTVILEDDIFSDETDDDDMPMIPFNTYMRNMQSMNRSATTLPPSMFGMEFAPMPAAFGTPHPPSQQGRSYASNTFEQNAGTPSNPLEIDLDDDDDEVEVFETRRSA